MRTLLGVCRRLFVSLASRLFVSALLIAGWPAAAQPQAFTWPVENPDPDPSQEYGKYGLLSANNFTMYHTGIDMTSGSYVPAAYNTPVYAAANGTAHKLFRTPDTMVRCDGISSVTSYSWNNHGLGNAVIISHPNGTYSLYGHLDCIWPGIDPGVSVTGGIGGTRIGTMGNSGKNLKRDSFGPHLHFEVKDRGVLGDETDDLSHWGYTPDFPDGYGYWDPHVLVFPFAPTPISPVPILVVAATLNVRTGPGTAYSVITTISSGQRFVAFRKSGDWYEIHLPNAGSAISGWIASFFASETLATLEPGATQIEVFGTGSSGLLIRPSASAATNLVIWDDTPVPGTCRNAKIWDGQRFVRTDSQSGWYEYDLPNNHYRDSSSCAGFDILGPSAGWSSAAFLNVVSGETLSVSLVTNPASGTAPLNGVDLTATVGGTATGSINYTFYCDRSDSGTNITAGSTAKFDGITENPKTAFDACNYGTAGTYTAKVIAERGALAAESRATVTVQAPPPTVTIVATDPTATEAGLTTGFFTVSRTGSTAAALTVSYTTDGTATAGSDYVGLAGSLTIPAGAGTATITVTPIDDSLVEGDETVVVTLSAGAGYAVGSPSSATVTIVSDDAFTDNPLISGVVIKAVHLTELRAAIDALRIRQGLAAFAWSDPMLGSGYTVKQVHLIEMRLALNDAYNKGGAGTPVYREPNIVSGQTAIHASHIQELRNFVLALE